VHSWSSSLGTVPRTYINIEKAAKLTIRENARQFCKAQWKPFEAVNVTSHSPETASPDDECPEVETAA
jgi:hypothetical protein